MNEIVSVVRAIAPGFAGINLEDISAPRCFEVEQRLQELLDIPVPPPSGVPLADPPNCPGRPKTNPVWLRRMSSPSRPGRSQRTA